MNQLITPLLTVAVLALFAYLAWRDLAAGFGLFTVLLPTYLIRFHVPIPLPGLREGLPTTLLELLFLTLFVVWALRRGRTDAKHDLRIWAIGMTLFAVGATIGVFVSPVPISAAGLWRAYFLEPFLFFVMFVDVVRDARARRAVLIGLGTLIAVVGASAVYQKFTGAGIPNPYWRAAATRRTTSFFGYPNATGLLAAPITAIMAGWATALIAEKGASPRERLRGLLPAASAVLGALGIIFAVSQGAMVGLAAGLGAFGLIYRRTRKAALIATIIACVAVISYRPLLNEISILASLRDDSGSVRRVIWTESLTMLADRPVFGAGLSGYPEAMVPYHEAKYLEIFQYPHSLLLNFWTETGLIGVAGFLVLIGEFGIVGYRIVRRRPDEWLPAAVIAAMVALLVHGSVDVPYFKNDLAMLFWIIVGLMESMRRQLLTASDIKGKEPLRGRGDVVT